MKLRILTLVVAALTLGGVALADDLLGGGKGNGGGGSSGGGGSTVGGGGGNSGGGGGQQTGGGGGNSGGGRGPSNGGRGQRVDSSSRNDRGQSPISVPSQRQGRSGRNTASTRNNNPRDERSPIVVTSIPGRGSSGQSHNGQGSIRDQARNEDRAYADRYRNGYYQYNSGWRDCDFWYPYYTYGYTSSSCISPFYFYSNLPGYLNQARVQFTDDCLRYDDWREFRYDDYDRYDRRSSSYGIYQAIDDLEGAFLSRDLDSLDHLIPRRAWITITDRTERNYRIRSEDFYDMMADLVTGTRTREFWVNRVETGGSYLRLNVQHVYQDAWRQNRTVYMKFTLRQNRSRNYEVIEFETSARRL